MPDTQYVLTYNNIEPIAWPSAYRVLTLPSGAPSGSEGLVAKGPSRQLVHCQSASSQQ
jgi:hypothetical protein